MKKLLGMKLHEREQIFDDTYILRVVGGWVYEFVGIDGVSICFVPEIKSEKWIKNPKAGDKE